MKITTAANQPAHQLIIVTLLHKNWNEAYSTQYTNKPSCFETLWRQVRTLRWQWVAGLYSTQYTNKPSCFETLWRQVRTLRWQWVAGLYSLNHSNQLTWTREWSKRKLSCMPLKVVDSFPRLIRVYGDRPMTCTMYQLRILTHARNDNVHWHKLHSNTS